MHRCNIGRDVVDLVKDVRRYTHGRDRPSGRDTTWALNGDRKQMRFRDNTMGYQVPLPDRDAREGSVGLQTGSAMEAIEID